MIDSLFHLPDGSTIETSIVGGVIVTRAEGPGWYSYKESAPMGPEYYPKRNGIKIHFWIILVPKDKQTKTLEWLNRQGCDSEKYGKYIKINWNQTRLFTSEQERIKRKIKDRLAEIYRPKN